MFTSEFTRTKEMEDVVYYSERGEDKIWFGKQLRTRTVEVIECRFLYAMMHRIESSIRYEDIEVIA